MDMNIPKRDTGKLLAVPSALYLIGAAFCYGFDKKNPKLLLYFNSLPIYVEVLSFLAVGVFLIVSDYISGYRASVQTNNRNLRADAAETRLGGQGAVRRGHESKESRLRRVEAAEREAKQEPDLHQFVRQYYAAVRNNEPGKVVEFLSTITAELQELSSSWGFVDVNQRGQTAWDLVGELDQNYQDMHILQAFGSFDACVSAEPPAAGPGPQRRAPSAPTGRPDAKSGASTATLSVASSSSTAAAAAAKSFTEIVQKQEMKNAEKFLRDHFNGAKSIDEATSTTAKAILFESIFAGVDILNFLKNSASKDGQSPPLPMASSASSGQTAASLRFFTSSGETWNLKKLQKQIESYRCRLQAKQAQSAASASSSSSSSSSRPGPSSHAHD